MAHELTFINRFQIAGRRFLSVPSLISEREATAYRISTCEETERGLEFIDQHSFETPTPHAFGDKINDKLNRAFAQIEEEIESKIQAGSL